MEDHPLWNKLDHHSIEIARIDKSQAALEARLSSTENRLDFIVASMSESKAASDAHHQALMKEIKILSMDVHQARGGLRFGLWVFGTMTAILGILAAFWRGHL